MENWAGNYSYAAGALHRPGNVDELRRLVSRSSKLKALGSRHSFNDLADTPGDQISFEAMEDEIFPVSGGPRQVTVPAGMTYGRLCPRLDSIGLAVPNLASLPHICVVGACATATHGSGDGNGNLATAVAALELVNAEGDFIEFHRDHDPEFFGAVVSLGGLGVVTRVTLDLAPSFTIAQAVYENLPVEELDAHFDRITSDAYSVSLFTDWSARSINQVWFKRRVTGETASPLPATHFGATLAPTDRHPIGHMSPINCTPQMGLPGPSFERLPHFRMDFTPSAGEELQSEYILPREHALDGIRTVRSMADRFVHLLQISEIRTIAADNLWMSPCYGRPGVGIHFTWKKDWPAVKQILPEIEAALAPFSARPHWGKLFTTSAGRLNELYERMPAFRRLLAAHDPHGKFRNAYLDRVVFG